ncbi:hypothetical protein BCR44DRAFT_1186409 [Catenaria anguillulae PL171]|uniref:Uncharacterized protein n=1 Tax=Catenaria anguillulae PL171 TaxID=765915 RepID=A0A1Y2HHC6_9FUNG|nr:hypothetical protein BCR44DRAFT_1186409 [Catenaria anguillulae PL171]
MGTRRKALVPPCRRTFGLGSRLALFVHLGLGHGRIGQRLGDTDSHHPRRAPRQTSEAHQAPSPPVDRRPRRRSKARLDHPRPPHGRPQGSWPRHEGRAHAPGCCRQGIPRSDPQASDFGHCRRHGRGRCPLRPKTEHTALNGRLLFLRRHALAGEMAVTCRVDALRGRVGTSVALKLIRQAAWRLTAGTDPDSRSTTLFGSTSSSGLSPPSSLR